jgi:subtilisin family serine protease
VFTEKRVLKRVIADEIDDEGVKIFKNKGCILKHRLKNSVSFDCPEDGISELDARESRVFHIVDLEADQFIGADLVWAEGIDGTGESVVILDTGVDEDYIEISDSIIWQWDFVNQDSIAEDPNGHGTHVAGIITANGFFENVVGTNDLTGVAPGSGRVCDASGSCLEDDMMAAMEHAVNNLEARIMSISIGGGSFGGHCDFDPLAEKVNWVVDNGYTVVVAAGNDGLGVSSPACASKAIAVGVVDKGGVLPYWSNRGTATDIVAPGVDIISTYSCLAAGDCTTYWYATMSGTSMSTPHVSGVAALLLDADPTLTDSEIKDALYTSASPVSQCFECAFWFFDSCLIESEVACTVDVAGAGIVNAYGAYMEISVFL